MDPFTRTMVFVGIKLSSFEIGGQERILKKPRDQLREGRIVFIYQGRGGQVEC